MPSTASLSARLNHHTDRWRQRAFSGLFHNLMRMQAREVEVEGMRIPYLSAGQGKALILLHGFADQKETWGLLAPWLSKRRRVIALDLPGYGETDSIDPTSATLSAQARLVMAFLDKLGLEGSVDVCGNSMGGGVALRLAQLAPDRVRSLILMASMGPTLEDSELKRRIDAGNNPLLPTNFDEYDDMLAFIFERPPLMPGALRRHMARRHIARRDDFSAQFDQIIDGVPDQYDVIKAPTLVIHGLHDRLIPASTGRALAARLPDARLMLIEDIGHAPQWEAPRRTLFAMERFFKQHSL